MLRHADVHLQDGGDTDRRIALIGFDQAIETSIEVYIRLHPRLRGGVELPREAVDRALRNFHTKIEFLEQHLAGDGRDLGVSVESIVWYHSLRNELYHSGNGMVPELHVVNGAREAAIRVFLSIFGEQFARVFGEGAGRGNVDPEDVVYEGTHPTMVFLAKYIELERLLRLRIRDPQASKRGGLRSLWQYVSKAECELAKFTPDAELLDGVRNWVVHSGPAIDLARHDELDRATKALSRLANAVRGKEF